MKTQTMILLGVVIAISAVLYFVFIKDKSASASAPTGPPEEVLGTRISDGKPVYRADIFKKVQEIKKSPGWLAMITKSAKEKGENLETAIWNNAHYSATAQS